MTSHLASSYMMLPFCYFAFTFLCSLSFPSSVHSIQCNDSQYVWPISEQNLCCDKCLPGNYLLNRCTTDHPTVCKPCLGNRYRHTHNVEWFCNICETCNRTNMEYISPCNTTHNAVCRCKAGYECKDQPCKQCVQIQPTIQPTLPRFSTDLKPIKTAITTRWTPTDSWWVLIIIALLSAAIVFSLVMKNKNSILRWIGPKYGYLLTNSHAPMPPCSEDEEVSKPVQEAGIAANLKIDPELE